MNPVRPNSIKKYDTAKIIRSNGVNMSSELELVPCNLCQGKELKALYTINNNHLVKCRRCGLIFVNPRPNEKRLLDMYENDYFQRKTYVPDSKNFYGYVDYLADEENIRKTFERVYNKLIAAYKDRGRLLDIGCALGFFLDLAKKRGWEVMGLEPSSYASSYARQNLGLSVIQGTLFNVDLPQNYFDLVTMFDVVEHLPDPLGGLAKINKSLKSKGLLALSTADVDSILARILGPRLEDVKKSNEHLYVFSRRTLSAMLKKAGFEVLKIKTSGKYFGLGDLLERLTLYHCRFFKFLKSVFEKIGVDGLTVYIDPGVKIALIARKTRDI